MINDRTPDSATDATASHVVPDWSRTGRHFDPATLERIHEHLVRGVEYRDRRQYDRAYLEFTAAYKLSDSSCDFALDNHEHMQCVLAWLFMPEFGGYVDLNRDGTRLPETAADYMAAQIDIPPGYLVVGHWLILASYPLTPQGKAAAIEHANRLKDDWDSRDRYVNEWLLDVPSFDAVVYEHETRPREIYRAEPNPESPPRGPGRDYPQPVDTAPPDREPTPGMPPAAHRNQGDTSTP